MALEDLTGTKYLDSLVSSNPTSGDDRVEGDDHIRGIKNTLKLTFPNVSGAVTPTHTELNYCDLTTLGQANNSQFVSVDGSGVVDMNDKEMTNVQLTAPEINDTSKDHQYVVAVSELAADRTVTLPLLTGNDEFTFNDHPQTLTNKTLTSPVINVTSDAEGDIYYRNSGGAFTRLAAGTAGQVLQTNGVAAPSWVDGTWSLSTSISVASTPEYASIPSTATQIKIAVDGISLSAANNDLGFELGSTTYSGSGAEGSFSRLQSGVGFNDAAIWASGIAYLGSLVTATNGFNGIIHLLKNDDDKWCIHGQLGESAGGHWCVFQGSIVASGAIDRLRFSASAGTLDAGVAHIWIN